MNFAIMPKTILAMRDLALGVDVAKWKSEDNPLLFTLIGAEMGVNAASHMQKKYEPSEQQYDVLLKGFMLARGQLLNSNQPPNHDDNYQVTEMDSEVAFCVQSQCNFKASRYFSKVPLAGADRSVGFFVCSIWCGAIDHNSSKI